jgi:hypothetical protein
MIASSGGSTMPRNLTSTGAKTTTAKINRYKKPFATWNSCLVQKRSQEPPKAEAV